MAIVGSSVAVGKMVVATLPVFLVAGLRFALASPILLPLLLLRERGLPAMKRRDAAVLTLQAFTGIFAFNTLLLYGFTLTSAAAAALGLAVLAWSRSTDWGPAPPRGAPIRRRAICSCSAPSSVRPPTSSVARSSRAGSARWPWRRA